MIFWITGGGTREPIDAVRFIGNYSTGRLACEIAQTACRAGHQVRLMMGRGAELPESTALLCLERFVTAADLSLLLLEEAGQPVPDVVIHAAAVADYAPKEESGKVASGQEHWTLVMHRVPKIAPRIRTRFPRTCLVTFKLETGLKPDRLAEKARVAAREVGADLVFANLLEEVQDDHQGILVEVRGGVQHPMAGRAAVAELIVSEAAALVEQRRS